MKAKNKTTLTIALTGGIAVLVILVMGTLLMGGIRPGAIRTARSARSACCIWMSSPGAGSRCSPPI